MNKTYVYKLYKSDKLSAQHKIINISGIIYNHCIALHKRYYKLYKKSLNRYTLQKHITKLKKQNKHEFWKQVPSQSIQDITDRIDKGYQLFYRNLKHKIKAAPPSFKKVKKYKSYTLKQAGYKLLDDNKIIIGKKKYSFWKERELEGNVKTVTIKRDNLGDFYICFSLEVEDVNINRVMTGKSAGFDFGMKTFLTVSDGSEVESPLFSTKYSKQVAKLNKSLAKKKKGSGHWKKIKYQLAKVYKKITNSRKDYFFKLSKSLTETYDYLFLEDLNMKGMQKRWGRKISDLSFATFVNILKYQATKNGSVVNKIGRFFPSSKTCYECGNINKELQLKDRTWICSSCGVEVDRDLNAARNIQREGASSLSLDTVRLALAS